MFWGIFLFMDDFYRKCIPEPNTGCWLWIASVRGDGYGSFWFNQKNSGAHRVSWELHNGPIPDGLCVLHKCDIQTCVNPEHLFLGTKSDNTHDMMEKGRAKFAGSDHLLSPKNILDIRAAYSEGKSEQVLAEQYLMTKQNICAIVSRRTWKHI